MMGYPKKIGYLPLYEMCSYESLAFTHPVRFKILKMLSEKVCTHEELCKEIILNKSTISYHLEVLLKRDLIEYSEKHPWIFYRLKEKSLLLVVERLQKLLNHIVDGSSPQDL